MLNRIDVLKRLLIDDTLDASDFILIAIQIVKQFPLHQDDQETLDKVLIDYSRVSYPEAIASLCELVENSADKSLLPIFKKVAAKVILSSEPQQVHSRRYFEHKFSQLWWDSLNTKRHIDSIDRLAHFVGGQYLSHAKKQTQEPESSFISALISDLKVGKQRRKVMNFKDMTDVIAALREYTENTHSYMAHIDKLRQEPLSLSKTKDRHPVPRHEQSVGYTMNPGIIRANSAVPVDDRLETAEPGNLADCFSIDSNKKNGYSDTNYHVPFVNSVSGTTYGVVAVLLEYLKNDRFNPFAQEDVTNTLKAFIAYTCKRGFHSLAEMSDVLHSQGVQAAFAEYEISIPNLFPTNILDQAAAISEQYLESLLLKKNMHQQLQSPTHLKHALFSVPFPSALGLSEKKHTVPKVVEALEKKYGEHHNIHQCKRLAEQYIAYARSKCLQHTKKLSEVRKFIDRLAEDALKTEIVVSAV